MAGRSALELILKQGSAAKPLQGLGADARAIEQAVRLLMTTPGRTHSLPGLESNMLRVGSIVRERLSLEVWQTLRASRSSRSPQAAELPIREAPRPAECGHRHVAS